MKPGIGCDTLATFDYYARSYPWPGFKAHARPTSVWFLGERLTRSVSYASRRLRTGPKKLLVAKRAHAITKLWASTRH